MIKKWDNFNESADSNSAPTYQDIVDMLESDKINLVGCDKSDIIEYINRMENYNKDRFPNFMQKPFGDSPRYKNSLQDSVYLEEIGDSYCVVIESGKPSVIIQEYELMNPFIFNNIVICPGHDSITCYDLKTKETKTGHIR
jgi:hypothetical protein